MTEFNPFGPKASSSTRDSDVRNAKSAHMQNLGMGGGSSNSVGRQMEPPPPPSYPDHSDMPMPQDCKNESTLNDKCWCWADAVRTALRGTYAQILEDQQEQFDYYTELLPFYNGGSRNKRTGCEGSKGSSWELEIPSPPCFYSNMCMGPGPTMQIDCDGLFDLLNDTVKLHKSIGKAADDYLRKHGNSFGLTAKAVWDKCMKDQEGS